QLHPVLSDVTGVTGLKMLRALLAGERDPLKLAQLRNPAGKSSPEEIAQARTGSWRAQPLFGWKQALAGYDCYPTQVAAGEAEIERPLAALTPRWDVRDDSARHPLPPRQPDSHSKNPPPRTTRAALVRLTGIARVAGEEISASLAQTILSEIGTDTATPEVADREALCLGAGVSPA
ncbi:MAG: IS110 family transposase, partial [Anaerolineales bacterium]